MAKLILHNVAFVPNPKAEAGRRVSDIHVEIADGEFAVLVGPQGSGKSTLLRLIAGLDKVAQGEIFIGERRVNDVLPKDREIAMVFRNYALYPHMSAQENIAFGLKMRKFPKTEIAKRVQEAAAILGIEKLLDRKPRELSTEEQLRVAIGRTLVRQPKVFLFDEPLANLDPTVRERMRTEIAKLHQRLGATMIYATRDSVDAMSMADRLVVLQDGAVQQSGPPASVYGAPANMFVAGFMGKPAMNLIHGTLKQERDSLIFRESEEGTIEVRLPLLDQPAVEFAGKGVVLGVRPEDLEIAPATESSKNRADNFPALVEVVEPMGAATNLHLQTGAHSLVCHTQDAIDRREAGRRMRFRIDPAKTHLFDPISTRRIE